MLLPCPADVKYPMNILTKTKKLIADPLFIVIPLCIWGLYLRFQIRKADLWLDEILQLAVINRPFSQFVKVLPQFEHTSYLNGDFFLMYPFLKIFGFNKWGLAIPHIIATILGFYLLFLICKEYFKTRWAYAITFSIVCFNDTLIRHAFEIRPYAVLPTLALAVFYLMGLLITQDAGLGLKKKSMIGIFFVLVIWFNHLGILMVFFITFSCS